MKTIILGTAHLKSTPGKCSPDKRLKEYEYSRKVCKKNSDFNSVDLLLIPDDYLQRCKYNIKQRFDFKYKVLGTSPKNLIDFFYKICYNIYIK